MAERVISYEFRARFDSFRANLAAGGKSVDDFGKKLVALDRNGAQMRQGLTELGGTAGKIGLVAAAGVGMFVRSAANFDQAMSSVEAATRGSAETMDQLRQAALDAGASTKFSATEAAGAVENLAKAGVSTRDILGGGLAGALDLAAAGNLEVAAAAEYTATALTQFQLKGDQAAHVADLLAAGAGKAQGEVADMANALNYAGVPAANLGVSIEETAGTIALFAKNGIIGEQAGTSMRGMLASLTSPSELAKKQMEALGLSVFDAQGKFVGFEGIAGQLQDRLGGLTDAERANALGKIFGNEQLQAANVLYREGAEGVAAWTDNVNDAGYASETAAIQMDNLKGDIEELGGALETAFIGAGDGAQGPLRSLVQGLTGAVNAFNDLPSAAQSTTTALLGITAVTGGAAWFGSKVINGIADTKQALSDLGWTAKGTGTSLGDVAKLGGRLLVVAGIVSTLGEAVSQLSGANLDSNDLARNLESIALGKGGETISRLVTDLDMLDSTLNNTAEPLQEAGRLFGLLGDTGLDKAAANIEMTDQALAAMVESGNAEKAAAIFDAIMSDRSGVEAGTMNFSPHIGEAAERFDSYALSLQNAGAAADDTSTANDGLAAATESAAASAGMSVEEFEAQSKALEDARKAATDTAHGFFNLGDSLNDAKTSMGGWIKDMEEQAKALRDFRVNAEEAGEKGVRQGLINALQEAGPEGALRMKQLAGATEAEIGRANRAWGRGQREINKYVDQVTAVPGAKTTNLNVNASDAYAKIRQIHSELNGLTDKHVSVWITERHRDAARSSLGDGVIGGAPKRRKAAGGPVWGPGGPTDDQIPAMLSNGEFVMRAAAVDYYGLDAMFAMNAMHLAEGGSTSGKGGKGGGGERPTAVWSMHISLMQDAVKGFERGLRRSEEALKNETAARDDAIRQRDAMRESVASGLRQDLWEKPAAWSGKAMDPEARAREVAANANEFTSLVKQLQSKGLDGPALAEVIASGDIERARMMASLSPAALNSFESAINAQESAVRAAGVASSGALGLDAVAASSGLLVKQLKEQVKEQQKLVRQSTRQLENAVDRLPKSIGREINGAATSGKNRQRKGPKK